MSFRLNHSGLAKVQMALAESMEEGLEELRRRADEHVPHDEGILELSGGVEVDPVSLEGVVYYDTPYAAALHEGMRPIKEGSSEMVIIENYQGKGEKKWLENTVKSDGAEIMEQIGTRAAGKLR